MKPSWLPVVLSMAAAVTGPTGLLAATSGERTSGPAPRRHTHCAFHEGLGKTVLIGGSVIAPGKDEQQYVDDVWTWDGSKWEKLGRTGISANSQRLIYHPRQRSLLFQGGFYSERRG